MSPENIPELTFVIPVYNEEANLDFLLAELIPFCETNNFKVIFVNDGSKDRSKELLDGISHHSFVRVINHKLNRGYGGALKTGLKEVNTKYALTFDGDGQHSTEDVIPILNYAKTQDADMVVGDRNAYSKNQRFRAIGKAIIKAIAKALVALPINDLNSGFKLYRTEALHRFLPFCPDTMAFSDIITLIFINKHQLVLERPITIRPRTAGKSTINVGTAFDTLGSILNVAVMFNPYKLFIPPAILCLILGLAWGIPIALKGRGVSVGSLLLIVLAAFLFTIGLIASQLSAIRMQMFEDVNLNNSVRYYEFTEDDKDDKTED